MTARQPARRGDRLTARELEIITLAAQGLTNAEIGRRLWLTANTVKTHMRHACAKLGARSGGTHATRAHAIHLAHERGLLGHGDAERHGDHAGYTRHVRAGEDPRDCPHGCHAGELAYQTQQRAKHAATQKENAGV